MARKEQGSNPDNGLPEKYIKFNKFTRNTALAVAAAAALVGAEALLVGGLLWAGSDQIQISLTERYKKWKKNREANKAGQGPMPVTVFERVKRTIFTSPKARTA